MKLQHCTVQIRCRRYFGIMELLLGGGKDFCGRKNMSPENIPKTEIPGERGSVTFFAAWGQYSGNDKCPEKYIYMTWGRFPNALICDFNWIAILVFWVICFLSYHGNISSITISKIVFQRKIHSTLCYPCLSRAPSTLNNFLSVTGRCLLFQSQQLPLCSPPHLTHHLTSFNPPLRHSAPACLYVSQIERSTDHGARWDREMFFSFTGSESDREIFFAAACLVSALPPCPQMATLHFNFSKGGVAMPGASKILALPRLA